MRQLFFGITIILLIGPLIVSAAGLTDCGPQGDGSYKLCTPIPGIDQQQTDFASFLRQLYRLSLMVAGTVVFVRVVYGGLLYTLSGVVDQKKHARDIIFWAFAGLALLMGSYVILYTINPAFVRVQLPTAQEYFPSPYTQSEEFQGVYNNWLRGQTLEQRRNEQDLQYSVDTIQNEINKLRNSNDPLSPEQQAHLDELTNERLPETQDELNMATRNRSSTELNRVNDQIAEIEKMRGHTLGGGLYRLGWFSTSTVSGLTYNEEVRLQSLYERRDSLIQQQRATSNYLRNQQGQ